MKRSTASLIVLLAFVTKGIALTIDNPALTPQSIGAEAGFWRWGMQPEANGGYGADGTTYTIGGNGMGVYWCWDACAAGLAKVKGDFTFTARIKSFGTSTPYHCGILVKAQHDTRSPVLSLRWDQYWAQQADSAGGITWFNRLTPTSSIAFTDPAEKGCDGSPGQGCLGQGYENRVRGFSGTSGIWLRVRRETPVAGAGSKYSLFIKKDGDTGFVAIAPVTSIGNPCGGVTPSMDLRQFRVPEDRYGEVLVGVFVADGSFGQKVVSAQFDQISLEVESSSQVTDLVYRGSRALSSASSWPEWIGPNGDFTANTVNNILVDSLHDAQLVWQSAEDLPWSKYFRNLIASQMIGPGCSTDTCWRTGGGGASPVYANGRVYLNYYTPSGGIYDTAGYTTGTGIADDVILCVDATDGSTAWKTTMAGKGVLHSAGKKVRFGNGSPVVHGSRLFALGSGGLLYCLDATTGGPLWEAATGITGTYAALTVAANVVVVTMGVNATSIRGYDQRTGALQWTAPVPVAERSTPARLTDGGTEFLIVTGSSVVNCVDPTDGRVKWTMNGVRPHLYNSAVGEGYLVCNDGAGTAIGGYRISPTQATPAWTLDTSYGIMVDGQPCIYQGHAYVNNNRNDLLCVTLATGKVRGVIANVGNNGYTFAADNRLFVNPDAQHGDNSLEMFDPDPTNFRRLGRPWTAPHLAGTTYEAIQTFPYADGRVFMRGWGRLFCYDLRKYPRATSTVPGYAAPRARTAPLHRLNSNPASQLAVYSLQGRRVSIGTLGRSERRFPAGVCVVQSVGSSSACNVQTRLLLDKARSNTR